MRDAGVCSEKNIHVSPSTTVSSAHHFQYAITGVPVAIASNGTNPKSSSGGKRKAFARENKSRISSLGRSNFHSIFDFDFSFKLL